MDIFGFLNSFILGKYSLQNKGEQGIGMYSIFIKNNIFLQTLNKELYPNMIKILEIVFTL